MERKKMNINKSKSQYFEKIKDKQTFGKTHYVSKGENI